MKSCRSALLLTVTLALAACQTNYDGNEGSPYYMVPPGARIALNQTLTIPPEQVSVWLQDGRVINPNDTRVYYPHCKFESRRRLPTAQVIEPDEFIVTRVTRALMHSVRFPAASERLLAAVEFGLNIGHDGPSVQTFATRMNLGSDRQPDVMRVTCGQWGYPYDGQHVTIAEIRHAFGAIMTLRLAAPKQLGASRNVR